MRRCFSFVRFTGGWKFWFGFSIKANHLLLFQLFNDPSPSCLIINQLNIVTGNPNCKLRNFKLRLRIVSPYKEYWWTETTPTADTTPKSHVLQRVGSSLLWWLMIATRLMITHGWELQWNISVDKKEESCFHMMNEWRGERRERETWPHSLERPALFGCSSSHESPPSQQLIDSGSLVSGRWNHHHWKRSVE